MANNSIGAYAQGGLNDIGAYEFAGGGGGTPEEPDWMDGVMTEDEWWTRRRKQFWHRNYHPKDN
jgi:hypothetical protein